MVNSIRIINWWLDEYCFVFTRTNLIQFNLQVSILFSVITLNTLEENFRTNFKIHHFWWDHKVFECSQCEYFSNKFSFAALAAFLWSPRCFLISISGTKNLRCILNHSLQVSKWNVFFFESNGHKRTYIAGIVKQCRLDEAL